MLINRAAPGAQSMQNTPTAQLLCAYCALSQLTTILQLDSLLLKWHSDLPTHLKFSLNGLDDKMALSYTLQRQKVILKMRFLGMRILLHRQSVLFLLQPPHTRKWPRRPLQRLSPAGPGTTRSASCLDEDATCSHVRHSPLVEVQLARISANICVQMAQVQIEVIDYARSLRLTGAWWWDFHCVFHVVLTSLRPHADWFPSCVQLPMCVVRRHWNSSARQCDDHSRSLEKQNYHSAWLSEHSRHDGSRRSKSRSEREFPQDAAQDHDAMWTQGKNDSSAVH